MMFPDLLADDEGGYEPVKLVSPKDGFTPEKKLDASDELDARFETAEFLEAIGAKPEDEITKELAREAATKSFEDFVKNVPDPQKKQNLANVKPPRPSSASLACYQATTGSSWKSRKGSVGSS